MPIRMAALISSATGETKSRKAIPKDARREYKRLYGVSREAILKVPAGTSKAQAKALHGQWLAEVETRIERIRAYGEPNSVDRRVRFDEQGRETQPRSRGLFKPPFMEVLPAHKPTSRLATLS